MSQRPRALSTRWRNALEEIAARYGFTLEQLQRPGRRFQPLCVARAECYRYLNSEGWTSPEIASVFARDHSTVLWWLHKSDADMAVHIAALNTRSRTAREKMARAGFPVDRTGRAA